MIFNSVLLSLLLVTGAAATIAGLSIPLASYVAIACGLVDKPDAKRKLHERPIPLVGGIVVFAVTVLTSAVAVWQLGGVMGTAFEFEHLGLAAAALFLLLVGVLDDRFKIRGRYKLMGQVGAATILIASGYFFDQVHIMRWPISFGVFSVLIVYFWILGAVNSVNLLDGADGFAGTLGLVVSIATVIMAASANHMSDAIIAASLGGALVGFLFFNLPPAKVYLGDAGSMVIGLILGALAISTSLKEQYFWALVAPLAILTIPIMDSTVAILRRKMTGRGIYAVDRGHIHHSLLRQGLSPKMAVLWMFVLCGTTAAGGVVSFLTRESEFALIAVFLVVGFLIVGRIFGFTEFKMVGRKVHGITLGVVSRGPKPSTVDGEEFQLQGTRDWGRLFAQVRAFALEHGFTKVKLDINAPWIHESYHGTWKSPSASVTESADEWVSSLPLVLDDRLFGRIEIVASGDECDAYRAIPQLIELLTESGSDLIASDPIQPRPVPASVSESMNSEPLDSEAMNEAKLEDSGVLM